MNLWGVFKIAKAIKKYKMCEICAERGFLPVVCVGSQWKIFTIQYRIATVLTWLLSVKAAKNFHL
ncbi:hypothetical protein A3841_18270 [Pontibacter flavimaris]|uniref:Uncharacterized protein n=1 Tax=Pontibacter flavimaris TaxID=1797110 RepID=A0A1Q5PDM8_9BACT|nr:hypothetical protein A3841_18270 [Pontibacter flavimaris]